MKLAMLFADGFEEIEAVTVLDVLRRASIQVDAIGLRSKKAAGAHAIHIELDKQLSEVSAADYIGVILPGGLPGAHTLRDDAAAQAFIRAFEGRLQAAICAAPVALEVTGVLNNKQVTSHPSKAEAFPHSVYSEKAVVTDGHVITSRGAGTAFEFSAAILTYLGLSEKAEQLRSAMIYN